MKPAHLAPSAAQKRVAIGSMSSLGFSAVFGAIGYQFSPWLRRWAPT